MSEWEDSGVILRSSCHERTWIGHLPYATHAETLAGPLGVVKAEMVYQTDESQETRWLKSGENMWQLQIRDRSSHKSDKAGCEICGKNLEGTDSMCLTCRMLNPKPHGLDLSALCCGGPCGRECSCCAGICETCAPLLDKSDYD